MSKKDFIALADAMRSIQPVIGTGYAAAKLQWSRDIEALADFCQRRNPRFLRDRWLSYIAGECGPNGGAIRK